MDQLMKVDDEQLTQYRQAIRAVFKQQLDYSNNGQTGETLMICDEETDNYLLMNVGWQGYERQHGVFVHLRIIEGQIHVEWNGTEDVIEALIELGLPAAVFVPAFRHPELRAALLNG